MASIRIQPSAIWLFGFVVLLTLNASLSLLTAQLDPYVLQDEYIYFRQLESFPAVTSEFGNYAYILIYGFPLSLGLDFEVTYRVLNFLAVMVGSLSLLAIGRALGSRIVGMAVAVTFSLSFGLMYRTVNMPDLLAATFLFLCFYSLIRFKNSGQNLHLVSFTSFALLGLVTKPQIAFVLLGMALAYGLFRKAAGVRESRVSLAILLAFSAKVFFGSLIEGQLVIFSKAYDAAFVGFLNQFFRPVENLSASGIGGTASSLPSIGAEGLVGLLALQASFVILLASIPLILAGGKLGGGFDRNTDFVAAYIGFLFAAVASAVFFSYVFTQDSGYADRLLSRHYEPIWFVVVLLSLVLRREIKPKDRFARWEALLLLAVGASALLVGTSQIALAVGDGSLQSALLISTLGFSVLVIGLALEVLLKSRLPTWLTPSILVGVISVGGLLAIQNQLTLQESRWQYDLGRQATGISSDIRELDIVSSNSLHLGAIALGARVVDESQLISPALNKEYLLDASEKPVTLVTNEVPTIGQYESKVLLEGGVIYLESRGANPLNLLGAANEVETAGFVTLTPNQVISLDLSQRLSGKSIEVVYLDDDSLSDPVILDFAGKSLSLPMGTGNLVNVARFDFETEVVVEKTTLRLNQASSAEQIELEAIYVEP